MRSLSARSGDRRTRSTLRGDGDDDIGTGLFGTSVFGVVREREWERGKRLK
jgi:hypothetical protein